MSDTKKLSKNIIIYGLSNALKSLVPFLMLPILTKFISAESYGTLSIIETSILFIAPFIILNLQAGIAVEYYKIEKKDLGIYISNGIGVAGVSFLIILVLFYAFGNYISGVLNISFELFLLLPVFIILRLIPTIILVIFQSQQKSIKYLSYSLFQTIADFALSYIFVVIIKKGYIGRLGGTYLSFLIFTIIGIYLLYRLGYLNLTYSKSKIKSFLKFGIPLIPHAIGGTVIALSDRYFISYFHDNSFVGLYTVSYQIGALLLLFSRSVNQAWSPMLFSLLKNKKYKKSNKLTAILFILFIIVSIVVYLSSSYLFDIFVDESYYTAKEYFPYLLIGFLFQSLYYLFTNFIFFSKRTEILALITFSGAVLNLILNYFLIKMYGVIGVAYATAITWFLFFVVTYLVFQFKIYPSVKTTN